MTLQMENRRLKKEAMERDDKLKQTLARMARAEEAAKRAALASAGNRSPGASLKGSSASARLFAAEQRVTELEEEARELTRKLQREHERGVHFKNMCKEYKVKLDEALKAARRLGKPLVVDEFGLARDGGGRAADDGTSARDAFYAGMCEHLAALGAPVYIPTSGARSPD